MSWVREIAKVAARLYRADSYVVLGWEEWVLYVSLWCNETPAIS